MTSSTVRFEGNLNCQVTQCVTVHCLRPEDLGPSWMCHLWIASLHPEASVEGALGDAEPLSLLIVRVVLWRPRCLQGMISVLAVALLTGFPFVSGKYRAADEEKINPPPYLTCESFPHAVDHILQHLLWTVMWTWSNMRHGLSRSGMNPLPPRAGVNR